MHQSFLLFAAVNFRDPPWVLKHAQEVKVSTESKCYGKADIEEWCYGKCF